MKYLSNMKQRLAALLTALAMVLALGVPAIAGAAAAADPYLKMDMQVAVNADALIALLAASTTDGEATEGAEGIRAFTEAINALHLTLVQGKNLTQLAVKAQDAQMLTLQAKVDEQTQVASITSSLIPGLSISLPQEAVKDWMRQQAEPDSIDLISQFNVERYVSAMGAYIAGATAKQAEQPEAGSFDIQNVGQFATRYQAELDSKTILGVMSALLDTFKGDQQGQVLLNGYLAANLDEEQSFKNAEEFIQQAEQAIKDAMNEENRSVAKHTSYQSADERSTYSETEFAAQDAQLSRVLLSYLQQDSADGSQRHTSIGMVVDNPDGKEPLQWDQVRAAIFDGSDPKDAMVVVDITESEDATNQQAKVEARVSLHSAEGQIALHINKLTATKGDFAERGSIGLAFQGMEPIVTFSYQASQVMDALDLEQADGYVVVDVTDSLSDEEGNLIAQTVFEKGLSGFLSAIPEDLMHLIGGLLSTEEAAQ